MIMSRTPLRISFLGGGTDIREIDRLNREFDFLEMKQQTDTLSVQEENEVIQKMRFNFAERNRLLAVTRKGEEFFGKLEDANAQIDRIFDEARKEHEAVVTLYRDVQAFGEQMNTKMNEASILIGEADRKHAEFVIPFPSDFLICQPLSRSAPTAPMSDFSRSEAHS